jgi:hypothetical protein
LRLWCLCQCVCVHACLCMCTYVVKPYPLFRWLWLCVCACVCVRVCIHPHYYFWTSWSFCKELGVVSVLTPYCLIITRNSNNYENMQISEVGSILAACIFGSLNDRL